MPVSCRGIVKKPKNGEAPKEPVPNHIFARKIRRYRICAIREPGDCAKRRAGNTVEVDKLGVGRLARVVSRHFIGRDVMSKGRRSGASYRASRGAGAILKATLVARMP
jgi:hypothetical protein